MYRKTSIYLFLVFLLSSCITNKDLDIFHTKDNSKINIVENKTIISDSDLLYVEIKSLTPTNYDFFNKSQDNSTSRLVNPHIYGFLVNDSGYVSLPILGEIFVRGKSLEETEKTIKNVAKDYFSNPFVKVVLPNNFSKFFDRSFCAYRSVLKLVTTSNVNPCSSCNRLT